MFAVAGSGEVKGGRRVPACGRRGGADGHLRLPSVRPPSRTAPRNSLRLLQYPSSLSVASLTGKRQDTSTRPPQPSPVFPFGTSPSIWTRMGNRCSSRPCPSRTKGGLGDGGEGEEWEEEEDWKEEWEEEEE